MLCNSALHCQTFRPSDLWIFRPLDLMPLGGRTPLQAHRRFCWLHASALAGFLLGLVLSPARAWLLLAVDAFRLWLGGEK